MKRFLVVLLLALPAHANDLPQNATVSAPALTAAQNARIGQPLETGDFLPQAFHARFDRVPDWRTGHNPWPPAPKPLTDPLFRWTAAYLHATPVPGTRRDDRFWPGWSFGSGVDAYPNADAMRLCGVNPFSAEGGRLAITARALPDSLRACLPVGQEGGTDWGRKKYLSGGFTSYPFAQRYGYFEMRARFPAGKGMWPAFWLLPASGRWNAEIDAVEWLGRDPGHYYASSLGEQDSKRKFFSAKIASPDPAAGMHAYGVDVGPDEIRFYLDRRLVSIQPTRETDRVPMCVIANLAVGGAWGGGDPAGAGPWRMEIEGIDVWQRRGYTRTQ